MNEFLNGAPRLLSTAEGFFITNFPGEALLSGV